MKRNFSVQTTLRLEVDFFERLKKEGESHRRGMTGVIEDLMSDAWFRKTDVDPNVLASIRNAAEHIIDVCQLISREHLVTDAKPGQGGTAQSGHPTVAPRKRSA